MSRLVRSALATGVGAAIALGAAAPVTTSASAAPAPVVAAAPAPQVPAAAPGRTKGKDLRRVVYVGNNWDGTADVLLPGSFKRIGRLDIVPDYDERIAEISLNPYRLVYYLAIQQLIGEGHDQLVDDMYSSNDGRLLIVSRPSFADVVALDLATGEIVWRFAVDGVRSDHMALSPDGETVVVSASTGNVVHALDVETGEEVGGFESGGSPHESVYLDDGETILHASIGMVYSPLDDPALDATKQERVLQLVDADTFEIIRRYDLRAALDEAGLEDVSTAVRPLTHTPDDDTFVFQLSFFHGFVVKGLGYAGYGELFGDHVALGLVVTTLGSVAVALLLASPPVARVLQHAVDPLGWGERRVKDALEVAEAKKEADELAARIETHVQRETVRV